VTDAPAPQRPDAAAIRERIIAAPGIVLDDSDVMRSLLEAGGAGGRNVIDLRGALVKRLETRLAQLERTHRSVIAAAYENLAGAAQVHRVALLLLEQEGLAPYLSALLEEGPQILAVDVARLCLEGEAEEPEIARGLPTRLAGRLVALPPSGIAAYAALGRTPERDGIWLRPSPRDAELIYGDDAARACSEALISLDLGAGARGLLALGSEDAARFSPEHGADLAAFLGGVVERSLRRWLPSTAG